MTILVDTNIVVEVLRSRHEVLNRWTSTLQRGDSLACSVVTHTELWQGVRPREERNLEIVLESMLCLSIEEPIGRKAGAYLRRFKPSHGIDLADALIAATATIERIPLWTRNRKHYPMPELRLID